MMMVGASSPMCSADLVFLSSALSTSRLLGCFSRTVELVRPCHSSRRYGCRLNIDNLLTHNHKSPGSDLEVPRLPNERDIAREEHLGVGVVHGGGGAQLLLLHLDLLLHLLAVRVEGDVAADLVWKQLHLKPLSTMMITLNHSGNTIR